MKHGFSIIFVLFFVGGLSVFAKDQAALNNSAIKKAATNETPFIRMELKVKEHKEFFPKRTKYNGKIDFTGNVKTVESPDQVRYAHRKDFFDELSSAPRKTQVIISEGKTNHWQMNFQDYRTLNIEWVTDEVIKFEIWPGSAVKLIELFNAKSGEVLFRSATGYYRQN